MITDLRYALRLLAKSPWFTSLTVVVLAGGLAISLYTYAALNMMIYRDLPLPDGGSIVRIGYGDWVNFEPLDAFELAELRAQAQSVDELGVYRESRALVGESGASRSILSVESDWRIFEFTRVQPHARPRLRARRRRGRSRARRGPRLRDVAVRLRGRPERRRHARENQRAAHAHRRRHAGRLCVPDEQRHLAAASDDASSSRPVTPATGSTPTRAFVPACRWQRPRPSSRRWCSA